MISLDPATSLGLEKDAVLELQLGAQFHMVLTKISSNTIGIRY